jgi:hypothetical protein
MPSSGMLRCVALARTDVSEELGASFIRVTRIGELGTTLAVTSNRQYLVFLRSVRRLLVTASVVPSSQILATMMKEALSSSETSVLTRATWRNIPEDGILHLPRRSITGITLRMCDVGPFTAWQYAVHILHSTLKNDCYDFPRAMSNKLKYITLIYR